MTRTALASLYLTQGKLNDAEWALLEGLKIDEYHPDFLRLAAVVYDRKQEPEKALNYLIKIKDHQRKDKNIVSFLGYLYQKTGHYSLARQQYFRLLQADPQNPLWLLGISIAFDFEGQIEAALEGYRRLISQNGIDSAIVQYARHRIRFLKG
jgi:MSHA biogenesis protein MshN